MPPCTTSTSHYLVLNNICLSYLFLKLFFRFIVCLIWNRIIELNFSFLHT